MIRFLVSALIHTLANGAGLLIATALLTDFSMDAQAFIVATLLFTVVEVVAGPLILKIALTNAPMIVGGIALVTTLVGLVITNIIVGGMSISGFGTWAVATLIVWLGGLLAGLLLPLVMFKKIMKPEAETKKE